MINTELKKEILSNTYNYLEKAKVSGFICPICKSGTGKNGTGIETKDNIHFTCFAGNCFKHADLIEIITAEHNLFSLKYSERLKEISKILNINLKSPKYAFKEENIKSGIKTLINNKNSTEVKNKPCTGKQEDLSNYFIECNKKLTSEAKGYLHNRGLTDETINRFNIGYDKGKIIIPTSKYTYTERALNNTGIKYIKQGKSQLYNKEALYQNKPVFITEGEFDALSIIQAGGKAVALGSTNNKNKFIEQLKADKPNSIIILSLDNDEPGRNTTEYLKAELKALNIPFTVRNISGEYKDQNEALTGNKDLFLKAIKQAEAEAETEQQEISETRAEEAQKDNIINYLDKVFKEDIERYRSFKDIKTGFKNLDEKIGGMYAGLYVLGAISSLGKTTFIHQIADQLAGAGQHIIFFSLEQSKFELASKSLARLTALNNINKAVSSLEIRCGNITEEVREAYRTYKNTVGNRFNIIEGNFNCNVDYIKSYAENYIAQKKVKPIIIIDYLQILQPEQKQSTKEATDNNITELKRLSRDNDITVIVISSLNRSNYLYPVDFESFKESGGIEYTADVIWGLQLDVINDDLFLKDKNLKEKRDKIKEAKSRNPREIELICLKNRYGISSYTANFKYYPQFDLFIED